MEEEQETQSSATAKYTGGEGWARRMVLGTSAATGVGASVGLIGGAVKELPLKAFAVPVTINFAIVGSIFCAMTELTREILKTDPGCPVNTIGGGLITGSALARIQGVSAKPFAMGLLFATVGTGLQFVVNGWEEYRLRRFIKNLPEEAFPEDFRELRREKIKKENKETSWPEWLPIRKISQEELERRQEIARRMREESRIE